MAVYKVAQDVEADDKLIGPFSFRQFLYLIAVAIALVVAWGLSKIFIGLIIIPLPVVLFFGALALPLRKDQPMEVYLAALVSYYLKPRKRMWVPDGIESLVQITAPKVIEVKRVKDIDEGEAERRLSYLADIADTRGWAVRHAAQPVAGSSMVTDAYFEAQQAEDVLDANGGVAQSFDAMITQADERRHQEMMQKMHPTENNLPSTPAQSTSQNNSSQHSPLAAADDSDMTSLHPLYNPYPNSMHQSVIQPLSRTGRVPGRQQNAAAPKKEEKPVVTTSEKPVSPDIINLASNTDLSIEAIQHEANRIRQKAEDDGEVFVSLH